jgi:hypothetical protein
MSTILDSLKKSSDSRGDNEKTSIDSFKFSGSSESKKSKAPVFLILLLLTTVILYFGYHYLFSDSNDVEATLNISTQITPEKPVSLIKNKRINKIDKPNNNNVKKKLQNTSIKSNEPSKNNIDNSIKLDTNAAQNNNFKDLNRPLKNKVTNKNNVKGTVKQSKTTDVKVQYNKNKQNTSIKKYKLAYQLPFTIRKDIPELILNIHVYDVNPHNRIAIINGEKFEVNALIEEQVLVKEIVLEGVVLEFKNEIFLLPKL